MQFLISFEALIFAASKTNIFREYEIFFMASARLKRFLKHPLNVSYYCYQKHAIIINFYTRF